MTTIKWGIIGPGSIAHNFADGIAEAPSAELLAIASRSAERRQSFGDRYSISAKHRHADYSSLVNNPAVDAVYISTPHPFHAEHAILAMRAGKPVLCEKPAGMTASQVVAITEVAQQQGVFFMEAFMYRCHPQIARTLELLAEGAIGDVVHIQSSFGFLAEYDPQSKAFNPELGGGAILDVGCYPVSFARLIAGAASGQPFANPDKLVATATLAPTGVDASSLAILTFDNGITAECATAITRDLHNTATITGTRGSLHLPDPWTPGRNAGPSNSTIVITRNGQTTEERIQRTEHLFAYEAEYASRAILDGKLAASSPALGYADSIGNAEVLDSWRHAVEYRVAEELPASNRTIPGVLPPTTIQIPKTTLEGVALPMSSLIMGCDNKNTIADGAIVWDAWLEAGGNAFDTAYVYGSGLHEKVLGNWIRNRGLEKEVVVTVKGAHSPFCTPTAIHSQLTMSLARLQLDFAPIYIMHRDNTDIPVGEFVDALNAEVANGRIGIFGGSNWSIDRLAEANEYAAMHQLQGFSILNNNLSLAVMERAVWPGCITSNTAETLAFLRNNKLAHFSWSSQARGYFLPENLRHRLPKDTAPETCFDSEANRERRRRAELLAGESGVSAHNIAMAWVLAQDFPSFALAGPRSVGEIVSSLPAYSVTLTPADIAWLNLERSER